MRAGAVGPQCGGIKLRQQSRLRIGGGSHRHRRPGRRSTAGDQQERQQSQNEPADHPQRQSVSEAAATAAATAGPTRGSSGLGTMWSGARSSPMTEKIAWAVARGIEAGRRQLATFDTKYVCSV